MDAPPRRKVSAVRVAVVAMTVGTTVGVMAPNAQAGAPNYECAAGPMRLGIDHHRRTFVVRQPAAAAQFGVIDSIRQNGKSVDLRATVSGARWTVVIHWPGQEMSVSSADGRTWRGGGCTFVPGNFVLGIAGGPAAIRTSTRSDAPLIAEVRRGALVWTGGNVGAAGQRVDPSWSSAILVTTTPPSGSARFDPPVLRGWVLLSDIEVACASKSDTRWVPGWCAA